MQLDLWLLRFLFYSTHIRSDLWLLRFLLFKVQGELWLLRFFKLYSPIFEVWSDLLLPRFLFHCPIFEVQLYLWLLEFLFDFPIFEVRSDLWLLRFLVLFLHIRGLIWLVVTDSFTCMSQQSMALKSVWTQVNDCLWAVAAMFVNGSGQNVQSLYIFHRCFLPSFSSFG